MSLIAYIFVVLSIVTIANTELVCPGYGFIRPQQPCVDECSPENDHCDVGKKCCYTPLEPCGYHCLVGKDNVAKKGKCPLPSSKQNHQYWNLCDGHFCDVDNDCPRKQKCCPNKCGTPLCIKPK
ncbi:unnamed protein product [Rotaria sp. Silwood1]|nr:unnamed protein product [Rotaria sp. Silwood1]CAF3340436.1 unnamed protein product [Rotaria sp. Silwood1]CAF3354920.1 unnamed protein product [Rotaria sp. Silwood1]CAF3420623.1 unnamed protein product [Rotaria sp. Silwood1]CAF4598548.1 unnamed protein product [Rotaria sp. Silwood1]